MGCGGGDQLMRGAGGFAGWKVEPQRERSCTEAYATQIDMFNDPRY